MNPINIGAFVSIGMAGFTLGWTLCLVSGVWERGFLTNRQRAAKAASDAEWARRPMPSGWVAPRTGGYTPKVTDKDLAPGPPPSGRGSSSLAATDKKEQSGA